MQAAFVHNDLYRVIMIRNQALVARRKLEPVDEQVSMPSPERLPQSTPPSHGNSTAAPGSFSTTPIQPSPPVSLTRKSAEHRADTPDASPRVEATVNHNPPGPAESQHSTPSRMMPPRMPPAFLNKAVKAWRGKAWQQEAANLNADAIFV